MKTRFAIAAAAAVAVTLAGCGSTSLSDAPAPSNSPLPPVQADPALTAKLPEKIRSSGTIVVGTDSSYAPNEFLDADGKTIIGMDVDLFNAAAAKMGVTVDWQSAQFDSIIAGVQGDRYDTGVSSFTVNESRKKQVQMVTYFNAGTRWATTAGNPKQADPDRPCGLTVAVQTGTVQQEEHLPQRQRECGDNKIDVLTFTGQDEATAALVSGRADAMVADSPIVAYAIQQTGSQVEPIGDIYDSAPYGIVVPKDETAYAEAIAEAMQDLRDEGTYDAILAKWNNADGAMDDFEINP